MNVLDTLLTTLESGQTLTPHTLRRMAALQAVALAKIGEDFANDAVARDRQTTEEVRKLLESQ